MKLTIGMATYEDYSGPYFTIQSLRLHHNLGDHEFILVDNRPDSRASKHLKGFVENWAKGRYIPMAEPGGTTQPRQRIFDEATGDVVLVLDSHVLLYPGAILELLEFYHQNPSCQDLISGPIYHDDFTLLGTHFDDVWRSQMWGIWGKAWQCPWAGCPQHFTLIKTKDDKGAFAPLGPGLVAVGHCPICHYTLPKELPWAGHEDRLLELGFRSLGEGNEAFEIPGQGLGLFACRRDSWLGFNPLFRGFGGEEMYIHTKYRQHGRKCLCLPGLKWIHRFNAPDQVAYKHTCYDKVRNYILGHLELGLPLDRVYNHFVKYQRCMPQHQWDYLIADPVRRTVLDPRLNYVTEEERAAS